MHRPEWGRPSAPLWPTLKDSVTHRLGTSALVDVLLPFSSLPPSLPPPPPSWPSLDPLGKALWPTFGSRRDSYELGTPALPRETSMNVSVCVFFPVFVLKALDSWASSTRSGRTTTTASSASTTGWAKKISHTHLVSQNLDTLYLCCVLHACQTEIAVCVYY